MIGHRRTITRRTVLGGTAATLRFDPLRCRAGSNWPRPPGAHRRALPGRRRSDRRAVASHADSLHDRFRAAVRDREPARRRRQHRHRSSSPRARPTATRSAPPLSAISRSTSFLYARMPFDPERDIVPVSLTYDQPNVAVVPSQHVPAKTLQEFIAWAKARA